MKINQQIFSLPPYISTTWSNIVGIFLQESAHLEIQLKNGTLVRIPSLDKQTIDLIFHYHSRAIEDAEKKDFPFALPKSPIDIEKMGFSFSLPFGGGPEGLMQLGGIFQHNSDQANQPDLPNELLEKVTHFAQSLGVDTSQALFPDAQPHCNCLYCQVGRAVLKQNRQEPIAQQLSVEEDVLDSDLKFKEWDIVQSTDHLFEVRNPLNLSEHYQVYLGSPIGCTCGHNNCEHIKAVLNAEI